MILAADLGSSSLKAGLLDSEGSLIARVRIPYSHSSYFNAGIAENFDPIEWEMAFMKALRQLPAVRLSAVALSGNGPTLVPCDAAGQALAPADLWLQRHSLRINDQPSYYLPKVAWLKEHNPEIWEKTRLLLFCPEWLQFRLTGRAVMTVPHNSFHPYVWDLQQFAAYGLDSELFPDIVPMGSLIGGITPVAAGRFGMPKGLPVVAVGSDFMAALLGSGAVEPGDVCDRAGTSEGINVCSTRPSKDERLRDLPHVIEGLWNAAAILSSTGVVFEWYRRFTGQAGRSYEDMLTDIDALPAGCSAPLFFPGPRGDVLWEFGGGSFHHLEPGHGPAEMGRAVMEAIGFAFRRGVELLEEAGLPVNDIRVTGGQARGLVWNQMKADITGRCLLIPRIEDAELAGGAACADAALGRGESPLEASRRYVEIRHIVEPRPKTVEIYEEAYLRYREAAEKLSGKSV